MAAAATKVLLLASALAVTVGAQPVPDISASRTGGVAPLAVFFDATNTTGLAGNDLLQAHFSWDFGDTVAGVWTTTGRSTNTATGFLCAHVYERPGTYTVTVTVRDRSGDAAASPGQVTIAVSDPGQIYAGANTRCVSQAGNFVGAPQGAGLVTSSDFAAQVAWVNGAANRRLLFRCGETWNGVTTAFSGTGPNTVGSYGPGSPPRFVLAANGPQACSFNASGRDWRLMDMEWDGSALPPHGTDGASASGTGGTDLLFSRLRIHHAGSVGWGAGGTHVCIHESSVEDNGYFSIYTAAIGVAVLGCRVDQVRVATSFLDPADTRDVYVAHNVIDASRAAPTTGIKWHSRRGVITDNVITAGTSRISSGESGDGWSHPVNQNLGVVLIERNVLRPDGNPANDQYTSTGIGIDNTDMVVRNNLLFDMNVAFTVGDHGQNARVYHNTCYMTDSTTGLNVGNGDFLNGSAANCEVRNNIMMSLNRGSNGDGMLGHFSSTTGLTMSNNVYYKPSRTNWFAVGSTPYTLTQWQGLGMDTGSRDADPLFVSVDTASPDFFLLQSGSPARGAGTAVPVFEDFNRNPRPLTGAQDAGALIFGSSAGVRGASPAHAATVPLRHGLGFVRVYSLDGRVAGEGRGIRVVGTLGLGSLAQPVVR